EILGTGTYAEVFGESASEHREAESGESGVFAVPAALGDALARSVDLAGVAERWAATEELERSRWTPADALGVLRELAQLTESRDGRTLWYWWSL
ncbi:MAG: hypothetical protein ACRDLR_02255, partial [Gaiellaceae bacterium]